LSVNQLNITPQYGFRNGGLVNTWLGADGDSLFKYLTNGYGINFQRVDSNYSIAVKDTNVTPGNTLNSYQSGFGRYQDWNLEKVGGQYGDTYLFHWRTDLDTNLCLDIRGFGQGQQLNNQTPVVWYCDRNNVNQRIRVIKQGQTSTPNQPSNQLPTSTSQANPYFKTQYNSGYNPDGPSASNNCGPASVAMISKLFGKEPANLSVQASINLARQRMGAPGNGFTDSNQLIAGLRNAGLQAANHMFDGSWQQLDQDLAAGRPVIAWGYYGSAWRNQFPSYALTGNGATDHLNTILGKTANGNYIVGDPMYRGGTVEMNRNQLAVFFSNGGGGHNGQPYFITAAR
jgi:Peptidase_C39 like family